jgi:hypothetical protein
MPWQFADGPVARMRLLHSLTILNGLKSKGHCCSDNNLNVQNQAEGID